VGLATAATKAIPSLAGVRMASAPTTPLPRVSGMPGAEEHHKRSVAAGIALWVVVVAIGLGAPALYAYKKGLLFFAHAAPGDSTSAVAGDTLAQRLLSDTGAAPTSDTHPGGNPPDTAHARPVPPGTPGRLTLQGLPAGARVTLNGMPFRGSQQDVPPGTHTLAVRASGFAPYDRLVVVLPGAPSTVRLELQPLAVSREDGKTGPCDQYGPAYNQDHLCFDTRPVPLSPTRIPVPADAPIFPQPAVLLFHLSRSGETIEAHVIVHSNLDTFNDQALDLAKRLRWNPAQKNGEAVEAWVPWQFQPTRETSSAAVAGARSGFITVNVSGRTGEVYVDNVDVGGTPLISYRVGAGRHTIRVRAGYRTWEETVRVDWGTTVVKSYDATGR